MDNFAVKCGWLLEPNGKLLKDGLLVVEDKRFSYIGKHSRKELSQGVEVLKYPKGLVVPPFINSHTHISETLIRGLCDDADLHEWLYDHVWVVEPKMNKDDAKIGAYLGVAEMVSSGTIGFVDQYFYANEIAEVVNETGMKALLAPSIFDGNPETKTIESGFKKNLEVLDKWHKKDNRIFIGFGPHAPYSVNDEWYQKIYHEADKNDTKIHTHLSETEKEVEDSKKSYGVSPIEKMNNIGVLDRIVAAHCVHLDNRDINLLKMNNVSVLHCPQSNLKIAAGIAKVPELIDHGINICLGTDGSASNNNLEMLEEIRLTAMIHRGLHSDATIIDTLTAFNLGSRSASQIFPQGVFEGMLGQGKPADFVVVDLDKTHTSPIINPFSNWIYAGNSSNVAVTVSDGRILYQEGKFETINIEDIKSEAQKSINKMMDEADYVPRGLEIT